MNLRTRVFLAASLNRTLEPTSLILLFFNEIHAMLRMRVITDRVDKVKYSIQVSTYGAQSLRPNLAKRMGINDMDEVW